MVTLYLLQMKLETRCDHNVQVRPSDQEFVLPKWRIYKNLILRKQPAKICWVKLQVFL